MYFYILQLRVRVADSQHFEWLHLTWPLVPVQEHPPPQPTPQDPYSVHHFLMI